MLAGTFVIQMKQRTHLLQSSGVLSCLNEITKHAQLLR